MSYRLLSAEAMHRRHQTTFAIPPHNARAGLRRGDYTKLIVQAPPGQPRGQERMWVRMTARRGDMYYGVLNSVPVALRLRQDARVHFKASHVIAVGRAD